jgi:CHAT domain-containing protein
MPSGKKSTYTREGFLVIALTCSILFLLFLFVPSARQDPSVELEPSEGANALTQLAPGSSLHRELGPGDKEVIAVWVGQGRVLRFSIEKGDLGLSTILYGPTKTQLVEHVSQEFEVVEISFPADVAGLYKIELSSRETAETRRSLELKVHPLAAVTARERKDSEARQAMARAAVLRATWAKAALVEAIEKYDKAALTWSSISDFSNASMAAIKAGDVCFRLAQYSAALKHFDNAANLSRRTGDRITEGEALSHIGHLYSYTGDNDLAYSTLTKALSVLEPRRSNSGSMASRAYAEAVSNMAEVIYAKGNLLKARNYFERARKMLPDDRKGRARTHLFVGNIDGTLGRITGQKDKAKAEATEALALYLATGDKGGEALARIALGLTYSSKRTEGEALKLYREAFKILRTAGDRQGEAVASIAIGQANENGGDKSTALQNYEYAFSVFENIGSNDFAIGALYKIATMHHQENRLDKALTYYNRALSLSRNAKQIRFEAFVLQGIALVYDAQGNSKEALKQYRIVLKFFETTGDFRSQAVALNDYGNFLLKLGQKQEALALYNRALPLSKQVGDTGTLLTTLYNLSRAHLSLGAFETALSDIKDSIDIIEKLRDNVGSPDLRALYFAVVRKHYELWIDILMQCDQARPGQGYDAEALLVSDRSRARSLIDLLSEPPAELQQGVSSELLERERELRGLISVQAQYHMELSLSQKNSVELAEVSNEIAQLRAEYQEVQSQLWKQTPKLVSLRSFAPTSLVEIQNELRDSDTMLLQYSLGNERSYLWAVTADSLHTYPLPGRKVIEDAAREVYPLFTARQAPVETIKGDYQAFVEAADNDLPEKASQLSQILLGPVASQLGSRKLIVVTEGALQLIPFEALPTPGVKLTDPTSWDAFIGSLLINTNEISSSPSISTLRAIRSEKKTAPSPSHTVAVIADPVFSRNDDRVRSAPMTPVTADASSNQEANGSAQSGLPSVLRGGTLARLTYSATEADAISAAAPRGTSVIVKGFDANRDKLLSSHIGDYQIVHFATHGFLDSEHPELSGIVLTMVDPKGVRQNGLLPLHDIYSLDLSAELTVLSACQTALGKDISGEGLVGLTHSFISAGSKSVVASLWKVDDRATSNLMTGFYESLLQQGMSTGAALRAAKLKTMKEKQWRAPYFWAGFVLQGEYTNHIAVEANWWSHPGWVLIASLVLVSPGLIILRRRRRRFARAKDLNQA